MLLGDEYRPTSFDALTFHPVLTAQLRRVASTHDMPHLLLYGPDGGGKKTRVTCILRHLYGPLATHLSVDEKTFEYVTPSKRDEIKVTVVASTFHVELNPSDFGAQDSLVIQELIKDLARGRTINSLGPSTLRSHTNAVVSSTSTAPTGTVPTTDHATGQMRAPFSVVVLHDVDRLSKHAQHALRRTMEKYTAYCRLILVCRNRTKLIEPLCSRCLLVRVPLPTDDALLAHVQQIAADQHLRAEPALLEQIVRSARGHIGRALRRLDTCRLLGTPTAVQVRTQFRIVP
jgi:replication factor C subunit 3/5